MRLESALISSIALLLSLILFFLGIFFLIPFSQAKVANFITSHLVDIGVISLLFAVLLVACFIPLCRRRYLLIEMGDIRIQEQVLGEIAQKSLASFFPGKEVSCLAYVRQKHKVEILANLPYVGVEDQEQVLGQIEEKLAQVFAHQCGLTRKFLLNVSFRAKMPSS